MSDTLWRIEMLGGLRAVRPGERTITRFRTQKTAALLAYLALHRGRPQPRELLRDLIWPDDTVEASSNALRVALNSLRKQLEPPDISYGGVLIADRNNVQLSAAACDSDVAQFTERLRQVKGLQAQAASGEAGPTIETLRAAVGLYQGDLLPGFFADWVLTERERLTQAGTGALNDLCRLLTESGDYVGAQESAQKAIQIAPYGEEAWRGLIRAVAMTGDAASARAHYERLVRLLRAELDAAPHSETRALAARLDSLAVGASNAALPSRPAPPLFAPSIVPATSSPSLPTAPASTAAAAAVGATIDALPAAALPFSFTRFFGRDAECARLCALLAPPAAVTAAATTTAGMLPAPLVDRLVTLTGAGGSGKTRLAVEVARSLAADYAQSVYFVGLGDEMDARRIGEAIATALHLPRVTTGDYWETVIDSLGKRPTLVVLDGFEQIAPSGGPMLASLLRSVPTLRLLVTSRRRLETPGERVVRLDALPMPPADAPSDELLANPSVSLFLDRAQATLPDFALTARNADDLGAVCRALEGIPLALELAAARVRALSLTQMREHMAGSVASSGGVMRPSGSSGGESPTSRRFQLLAGRRGDNPDRHQSLWATIDWSYSLLPPPLRRFFRSLAVFRGGWTLEAAEDVCGEPYALEYLTQLRAHSLVVAEEGFSDLRFHLLDSLREFADEHADDEERRVDEARHLAFYTHLAEASDQGLRGAEQSAWLDRMDADADNLRVALARCTAHAAESADAAEAGMRLAGAMFQYWQLRGSLRESAEKTVALLGLAARDGSTALPTVARALASNTAGVLFMRVGDYEQAERYIGESVAMYRTGLDLRGLARALSNYGVLRGRVGDRDGSRVAQEEGLALHLRIGDRWGAASGYNNLGVLAHNGGDKEAAADAYRESLNLAREIGDVRGTRVALLNLANLAVAARDYAQARALYDECLANARAQGVPVDIATALFNMSSLELDVDEANAAEVHLTEALAICRKIGDLPLAGAAMAAMGHAALHRGEYALARARLIESLGLPLARRVACDALELAAKLADATRQEEQAVVLSAAAATLRVSLHLPPQANLVATHEALLQRQREKLDEATFNTRWQEGAAMTMEQAIERAKAS